MSPPSVRSCLGAAEPYRVRLGGCDAGLRSMPSGRHQVRSLATDSLGNLSQVCLGR
jgi:hypothetical protein